MQSGASRTLAKDIPEPIVFGPDFPNFKMLMRQGRQVFESRTNRNLLLHPIWDSDGEGTFTLARLLRRLGSWQDCLPLFFEEFWLTEDGELIDWTVWAKTPGWDKCQTLQDLAGYCRSRSQREFFWRYLSSQYRAGLEQAYDEWCAASQDQASMNGTEWTSPALRFGDEDFIWRLADLVFDFPAAIPEVWLNYVGYDKTIEDEAHLAENPQRVDFVILADSRKCVVEIDGPSHYADYEEETRTYTVNEDRYAKNLAIERSLRRHGWEIYRFANVEVDRVTDDDAFVRLAEHLPGFASTWYGDEYGVGRPGFSLQLLHQKLTPF